MFILPVQDGNPPKKFPLFNLCLILANVYFFLKTASSAHFEQILFRYGFTPAHPHLRDVASSLFLHAGWMHLMGNMYFLYVFGNMVEDRLGKFTYLYAYFISGIGACLLQYLMDPHSTLPLIGASGAISGICALYMFLFPWQKMRLEFFFLIFPIFSIPARAFWVVGFWFAEQYWMARTTDLSMGGVAFWAHVGGFLAGVLMLFFINPKKSGR